MQFASDATMYLDSAGMLFATTLPYTAGEAAANSATRLTATNATLVGTSVSQQRTIALQQLTIAEQQWTIASQHLAPKEQASLLTSMIASQAETIADLKKLAFKTLAATNASQAQMIAVHAKQAETMAEQKSSLKKLASTNAVQQSQLIIASQTAETVAKHVAANPASVASTNDTSRALLRVIIMVLMVALIAITARV